MTRSALIVTLALLIVAGPRGLAEEATLVEAAKSGDAAAVRALVAAAADVNAAEPDGTTALHWAVHRSDIATVDLLLRSGASVQAATRYGVTPLHLAVTNGSAAVVSRLLEAGADPNTALPDGETVLMTAARTGDVASVQALLDRGADVHATDPRSGQTALMWAAAENNAGVVRALVKAGADVHQRSGSGSFTALLFAVRGGHIDAARALVEAGADVDETLPDGTSALLVSVINAHWEMAAVLLELGADPNASGQGWTALHQIAWSRRHNVGFNLPGPVPTGNVDSLDLVRMLVRKGADVNARQAREPRDGNRNMLNRIGSTPFLLAAKSADVPLMRTLLEVGADPSITTERGTTALMVAAGVGIWAPGESPGTHDEALAAVKLAYEAGGGDVNAVDQDGETALHGAVYRGGAVPVIQFLADRGARLDAVNAKGWSPVFVADGVEYTPNILKRYPEAAALLRRLLAERGLPVPPPSSEQVGLAASANLALGAGVKSTREGVFTEAQATRGQQAYRQTCSACHGEDLAGSAFGPALNGEPFATRWQGTTASDMVDTIRRTMPSGAPDSLGVQTYVDIVAYLLKANGSPAGGQELPVEPELLRRVAVQSAQ